ncbi:hypothetical protein L7F22_027039 [Adiantum nelumboides]|nr:hypothetical protein [Adiantum nelumboides]
MRPYSTPSTPTEKLFNFKILSTRIVAERAFGWLKMKWRYLHGKVMKPYPHHLARAIIACCMLHNICLDSGEDIEQSTTSVANAYEIIDEEFLSDAEAMQDTLAKFLHPLLRCMIEMYCHITCLPLYKHGQQISLLIADHLFDA